MKLTDLIVAVMGRILKRIRGRKGSIIFRVDGNFPPTLF